jgi:hypothetical protein
VAAEQTTRAGGLIPQAMKRDADFGLQELQARVLRRVDRVLRWKKAREVPGIVVRRVVAALCFVFWRDRHKHID